MTTNVFNYSLLAAVVIVAAIAGVWYLLDAPEGTPLAPGRIEGTTSYPSEYLPAQIVCAEPVDGGESFCTDAPEGYAGELTPPWSIEVPAGDYYIYARLRDPSEIGSDFGDYRAYETAFVRCGMDVACTDHARSVITVGSGATVTDVRPYDWYIR